MGNFNFVILFVLFAGAGYHLEINGSYTTSFQCLDDSYALISGDTLTLEYNYGHNFSEVRKTLCKLIFSFIAISNDQCLVGIIQNR